MDGFRSLFFGYVALVFFLLKGSFNVEAGERYSRDFHPPLDIPLIVSGSFGELRGGHFHSGVDFTTQGRSGLPIFSIDDGYVSRIFISPVGFGKAVYINHPGGLTSVYAHCVWFSDELEQIAVNIQYRLNSFAIDQYFKPGEIPVRRGQLIAYAGNSGSSRGPHLHFEIRDTRSQRPLNVHYFNFPVKDDVAPVIRAIVIYPLGEGSSVNGSQQPLHMKVSSVGGRPVLQGNQPITASGTIGVGIETHDYFNASRRELGVYSVRLNVDGEMLFKSRLDDFAFNQTRYLNSHIDFKLRELTGREVQKSFLDENNQLDIYTVQRNKGKVRTQPGQNNEFQYIVSDAAGNHTSIAFTLRGVETPAGLISQTSHGQLMLNPNLPWSTTIDGFTVSFPANSFYTPVPVNFFVAPNPGRGVGNHFHVLDATIPVHNFFEVSIPLPPGYSGVTGITGARVRADGTLVHASGTRRGNHFVIRTREAGVYCLAIDEVKPVVRLRNTPAGNDYSRLDAIRIELRDNFSGIASFTAEINGNWALFEHDPKNNEIAGFFRNLRIQRGQNHQLRVVAYDNAGNRAVLNTWFVY